MNELKARRSIMGWVAGILERLEKHARILSPEAVASTARSLRHALVGSPKLRHAMTEDEGKIEELGHLIAEAHEALEDLHWETMGHPPGKGWPSECSLCDLLKRLKWGVKEAGLEPASPVEESGLAPEPRGSSPPPDPPRSTP